MCQTIVVVGVKESKVFEGDKKDDNEKKEKEKKDIATKPAKGRDNIRNYKIKNSCILVRFFFL